MRFLFRLVVLALAAFGAKSIYDRLWPQREQFKSTGSDFVDRAGSAVNEVGTSLTQAAQNIATTAQENLAAVKTTASEQADEVVAAADTAKTEALQQAQGDDPASAGTSEARSSANGT